ncbi:MAG: S8 family serine peptidase [Nocardioides sp.]
MRVIAGLATLACGCALGLVGVGPLPPAVADDNPVCEGQQLDSSRADRVTRDSPVLAQLDVPAARDLARRHAPAGQRPVRVAVLDSGVIDREVTLAARWPASSTPIGFHHGTTVAGLIAGDADGPDGEPIGIAPDAEIVDVRVYDDPEPEEGAPADEDAGAIPTSARLAEGLTWVAENARALNIRVANVSLGYDRSRELREAVREVRAANVVLVASAGNRPVEGAPYDEDFADGTAGPREDGADVYFPSGYRDVVSVSATPDGADPTDPSAYVVENSHTSVAAPTYGAVSLGLNGAPCVLEQVATSWAAAEVSGVLALLWQRFPDDTDEQIVARLVNTANGTPTDPSPLTGAGVVQPLEALTRPLDPSRAGEVERTVVVEEDAAAAVAPEPEDDLLAAARDDAVWWGLIGGGVLVIALLLRPVLARRRR